MRVFSVIAALIGLLVTGAITAGAEPAARPDAASAAAKRPSTSPALGELPTVTPTPQQVDYGTGFAVIPKVVSLVAGSEVDGPTLATIEQALREAGVQKVRRGTPSDPPRSGFTVVVGQPDQTALVSQRLDDLGVEGPDGLADDGYVLASGRTDDGAQVVLAGVDSDGTYYAAKTFAQLPVPLDDTFALPDVEVRDWPAMSVRGTIEGFYGTPWSHQQRLRQMDFYGDMKMNVYAYAPKDDPYHRERWDEPYPPSEIDRLAELVDRARSNHVDFIFALSPGLSICYSSDEDIDALVAKFESMYDIGVRRFNVALDDINYTDWHCPQDPERFGTGAAGAGAAQSYLLNQVVTRFADQHADVERIQMVPTEYYNVADTAYKRALREQMDPSVVVEWTGIGVVPATITTAQAADAVDVFGHDILVWDNYPVNDYAAGQLLLGPFNGREQGLSEHLYGLHANPMNQAEASKIPLVTVADYVWNDTAYDPQRSLRQALEYVGHGDPALVEALGRFVDVNYSSILNPQNAPRLSTRIDDFWKEYDGAAGGDRAAAGLAGALDDLAAAPGVIRERIDNPLFLAETDVWLDATRLWAKAADAALRMLQAQQEGDGEAAWTARLEATAAAAQARALRDDTVPHRNAAPKVGTGVVDVFVDEALSRNDDWLGASPTGAVGTSSMSTYQDNTVDRMVDGDLGTFYWSAEAAGSGDFVGVDLGQPREIEQIDVAMAKSSSPSDYIQHGVLEISADGSRWTPLGEFDGQPEISVEPPAGTEARYVRLRATAGQNEWVVVREFGVEVKGGVSQTVTGGPPPAAGSRLSAAADGDPGTALVAARAPEADETLTVEYSVARPLSGVVVLQDPASPAAATVEVRTTDGWTALGSLDGGYTEVGADDQEVDAIRLRWAGGEPAPRIHEVIGWFAEAPTLSISPDALYVEAGGDPSTATVTVAARSLQDRTGTVTVEVPAGWSADPASTQVTVGRGQAVEIPVDISAPEGSTPEGDVVATLEMGSQNVAATINARLVPPVSDENIARAGVATASSVELDLPQFAPRFAIDGDSSTRWSSGHTDDEWLQVELTEPTRVGKVVLTWERACASAYQVEVSSDGEAWTTVASVPETDCGTDEVRFDSAQPVQFVRMQGLGRATEWGYSIYEFEIYPVA